MARNTSQLYLYIGITLFLAIAVRTGLTLLCWECNSEYDRRCADSFNKAPFLMTDCAQRFPNANNSTLVCRKMTQKVKGQLRYIRACGYLMDERNDCYRKAGTFDAQIEYCQCQNENGCNSAPIVTSANVMLLVALAVAVFSVAV